MVCSLPKWLLQVVVWLFDLFCFFSVTVGNYSIYHQLIILGDVGKLSEELLSRGLVERKEHSFLGKHDNVFSVSQKYICIVKVWFDILLFVSFTTLCLL